MTIVDVQSIHATQVAADMLITTIGTSGLWFGGMDDAIKRVSRTFYTPLRAKLPLADGEMIHVTAPKSGYQGLFGSVLFIADGLKQPLGKLVTRALDEADQLGMTRVVLPMFRTGVLTGAGAAEKTIVAIITQLAGAISTFVSNQPAKVQTITIAVPTAPTTERLLRQHMRV